MGEMLSVDLKLESGSNSVSTKLNCLGSKPQVSTVYIHVWAGPMSLLSGTLCTYHMRGSTFNSYLPIGREGIWPIAITSQYPEGTRNNGVTMMSYSRTRSL